MFTCLYMRGKIKTVSLLLLLFYDDYFVEGTATAAGELEAWKAAMSSREGASSNI